MDAMSKALRYRRLAARETNRETISLLTRLADETERQAQAKAQVKAQAPREPAYVVSILARRAARVAA